MKTKNTYNRFLFSLTLFMLVFNVSILYAQDTKVANPYSVKSAYLVNICKFTTWKNEDKKLDETFKIYTIGELPEIGGIYVTKNIKIKNRDIEIINLETKEQIKDINDIDVLFIYSIDKEDLIEILEIVSDKDILTVSDTEGFGEAGVIINFFIKAKKVNFELNRNAELKSEISLKSMLYKVKGNKIID